jgi:hypothetical protein
MKTFFTVALSLIILINNKGRADINMKDGAYLKKQVDLEFLPRTYNSRSLHSGYFGFGWCTPIESRLEEIAADHIRFKSCVLDADLDFFFKDNQRLSVNKNWRLIKLKNKQILILSSNTKWLFNSDKKLIQIDKNLRLYYEKNQLTRIQDIRGKKIWKVKWYDSKISEITQEGTTAQGMSYTYNAEDLIMTTPILANAPDRHLYTYDEFHNLTTFQYQNLRENIVYDSNLDTVKALHDQNCIQTLEYHRPTPLQTRTISTQRCRNSEVQIKKFDFWYTRDDQGRFLLKKVQTQINGNWALYLLNSLTGEVDSKLVKSKSILSAIPE